MTPFSEWDPVLQAFIATVFTWLMTATGASVVFFMRRMNRKILDLMLGFAAGVMIAASVWSLLIPAMSLAGDGGSPAWLPALLGFIGGGVFLYVVDRILPHVHSSFATEHTEGLSVSWSRTAMLLAAITMHNIPEGLAVGVAFGAVAMDGGGTTLAAALTLALGIGIQNLPEGTAVALPIRGTGASRLKSFFFGQLSAVVEPVAAVIGAALVTLARPALPYALAFAAGAMIYVVVEDVIPESQEHEHSNVATGGAMAGFALMMLLDVALS